jgi:hypothetical protein
MAKAIFYYKKFAPGGELRPLGVNWAPRSELSSYIGVNWVLRSELSS